METTTVEQEFRRRASDAQLNVLQSIEKRLNDGALRDNDTIQHLRDELRELRMIITGPDGQNGLRSQTKKHSVEIENLKRWQTQFMAVFAIIQIIGVPVAIYVITHMIK